MTQSINCHNLFTLSTSTLSITVSWDVMLCLPNNIALHRRRPPTLYYLQNFNLQLWSLSMLRHFSLKVLCPVHTHTNRTVQTLVLESEGPVMLVDVILNVTIQGSLYTCICSLCSTIIICVFIPTIIIVRDFYIHSSD